MDILIVGHSQERFSPEIRTAFRHWQVYSVAAPHALHGRKFRHAYVTEGAISQPGWPRVNSMLVAATEVVGGEVLRFSEYQPGSIDAQAFQDEALLREIRRSRYPSS